MHIFGYPLAQVLGGAGFGEGAGGAAAAVVTLQSYLLTLAPPLLMDGTLNGSNIKNLGTVGVAMDGVPTAVTIDANGMDFNGTTSMIVIPTHASINQLETQSWAFLMQADNAGEGNSGLLMGWGAGVSLIGFGGVGRLFSNFNFSVVDPVTFTDAGQAPNTSLQWLFVDFNDATDKIIHMYKGIGGVITEFTCAAPTAGSGTHVAEAGSLHIGNVSTAGQTFDGKMKQVACFDRLLTTPEKLQLIALAGV